jgi:hypothetical protein
MNIRKQDQRYGSVSETNMRVEDEDEDDLMKCTMRQFLFSYIPRENPR